MRENVTQGACPLASALTTGALNHPAFFLLGFPLQQLAELGEGRQEGCGGQLPPSWVDTSSSWKSKAFAFSPLRDAAPAPASHEGLDLCYVLGTPPIKTLQRP